MRQPQHVRDRTIALPFGAARPDDELTTDRGAAFFRRAEHAAPVCLGCKRQRISARAI
jgi:hypothetical protein